MLVSVVLTAALVLLVDPIVSVMSTPAEAVDGTARYLSVCFIGIPFITAYNIISSIFRGMGDSKSPMYFIAVACAANIALDYLFMGAMRLGPVGAALGTTLAQAISVLVAFIAIRRRRSVAVSRADLRPRRDVMGQILGIGMPVALQDGLIQIAFILITVIANLRGLTDSAAVGIVEKLISFLFLVPSSMLSTVSAIGAQNIGAGKFSRIRKGIRVAMLSSLGTTLVLEAAVLLFSAPLLDLFTDEPDAKTYALQMMLYLAPTNWLFIPSDVLGGAIRGAGQAMKVTIISAVCICVFRVIWLIVTLHFDHNIRYVFLCYPTSWLLSSAAMGIFYFKSAVIRKTLQSQDTAVPV